MDYRIRRSPRARRVRVSVDVRYERADGSAAVAQKLDIELRS